jgi:integration host factor subunit beta
VSSAPRSDSADGDLIKVGGVTITKKDLVNRIAERTGVTKVVTKTIIQMFLDEIVGELSRGNRLEFRDFGVFEVKARRARRAQNPRTLEKVDVPPKRVVKFKVGRVMRDCVMPLPPEQQAPRSEHPTGLPGQGMDDAASV